MWNHQIVSVSNMRTSLFRLGRERASGSFVAKPKKHELFKRLGDESEFDSDGM